MADISRRSLLKFGGISAAGLAAIGLVGCNSASQNEPSTTGPETEETTEKQWNPEETIECDVVVVGAGSGLWAAYQTASAGLKTIVLEKADSCLFSNTNNIGGTTAADTSIQKAAGVDCPIEKVYSRLMSFAEGTVNQALVRRCLEASGKVIDTLSDLGVEIIVGADRYGVGFDSVHVYMTSNKMSFVEEEVLSSGADIHYGTEGEELIVENGSVVGVYATSSSKEIAYRAKAVVLATGGFLEDDDMLREIYGDNIQIGKFRMAMNDGAGIKMAKKAGAMMDTNFAIGTLADVGGYNGNAKDIIGTYLMPDTRSQAFCFGTYGSLHVDHTGERFINEYYLASNPLAFGGAIQTRIGWYYAIADQKMVDYLMEHSAFDRVGRAESWLVGPLLFDEPQTRLQADIDAAINEGWAWKGETLEELSKAADLPLLSEQVARYNEACTAGKDTEFFSPEEFLISLDQGPYYAIQYQIGALSTMGGIRTDNYCRAVDGTDTVIPGLYISSSDNGSAFNAPYYDTGGTCNAMCIGTSWVAGETVVSDANG